jgi:hypothetical protein
MVKRPNIFSNPSTANTIPIGEQIVGIVLPPRSPAGQRSKPPSIKTNAIPSDSSKILPLNRDSKPTVAALKPFSISEFGSIVQSSLGGDGSGDDNSPSITLTM